jgi:Concanavalin A-like lectin/glucanases superfamily/Immunoglobulin domain/Carboxypeptidase regulatory-like domain/Immunoglobulin I-set domain
LSPSQFWQFSYTSRTGLLQVVSNTNSTYQISGSVTDSHGNGVTNIGVFAYATNSTNNLVFTAYTGSGGAYSMNVPNGTFQVGLEGLPDRGYNPVTNQSVTINNASQTVNFVLQPYGGQLYTVTTTINPSGAGSASGAGTYSQGSVAEVTATATPGMLPYWFGNWSENGVVVTTNNSYAFVVNGPDSFVANFVWPSPVITLQPQSQTVVTGAVVTLSVAASGAQPISYQWQFNGTNLVNGGQINGSQSNILAITNVQLANAGDYQALIGNAYGSTNSEVAALFVDVPSTNIPAGLTNALVNWWPGNGNAIDVVGGDDGVLQGGVIFTNGLGGQAFSFDGFSGYVSTSLLVTNPQSFSLSLWFRTATTQGGVLLGFAGSQVGTPSNYDRHLYMDNAGAIHFGVWTGAAQVLNSANGYNDNNWHQVVASLSPSTGISLFVDGVLAEKNPAVTDAYVYNGWWRIGENNLNSWPFLPSSYYFNGQIEDAAIFNRPLSSNEVVELYGQVAAVGPPVLVAQPVSQSPPIGATVQFNVGAVGSEPLSYQWQLNGANLTDNGSISGSQSSVLTIPDAQVANAGDFQAIVTNSAGSVTSAVATLTVSIMPGITAQPQNQSVGLGGTAVFSVGVSGTGPFYYQWLYNGDPLPDANGSTLTLANVQASEQGQYSVAVYNDAGGIVSAQASLTVLGYCASAQSSQAIYPMGSVVPITVQTFVCDSQTAMPNQIATVWISNNGFVRSLPATTGASGSTTVNFIPLATETGFYQVAASLPGQAIPTVQGSFTLVGMALSTNNISGQVAPGIAVTNIVILTNLTSVDLTGLSASVVGSTPDVTVQLNVPGTLSGNATGQLSCVLTAPGNAPAQDQFSIVLASALGTTNLISVTATVVPAVPQLAVTPSSLNASMVQGGQTLVNFWVENIGGATSGPVSVDLPQVSWLTQVTPQPISPLAPGQSNEVTLALTPPSNLTLGANRGNLELTSSNQELSVPFTFDCISTAVGALQVTVQDELTYYSAGNPNVSNATITVSDFQTGDVVTDAVTDGSGIVLFTNLTSAYYNVSVTAPDHSAFSATVLVSPEVTNDLTAFLPLQLVDYTWLVTPTGVSDEYQFTLDATFATQVPWPVVTVNPAAIDLCDIQGDSTQIDLTITNSGLIAPGDTAPGNQHDRAGEHNADWLKHRAGCPQSGPGAIELFCPGSKRHELHHRPPLFL